MILSRENKQKFIAVVYFIIVVILGVGVYYVFVKPPETCFDNKQNQDEAGVDCGGVCQAVCEEKVVGADLELKEATFVQGGNGEYDVLVKIHNPNDAIGATSFAYTVDLKNASGETLVSRSGTNYILPQENKYIFELNFISSTPPAKVSLQINEIKWARFSGYQEKPSINIYQKRYNEISSASGFSEAFGLVVNNSPYDFRSIIVKVILRDADNKPLAFNTTEMRTVKSKEERDFRLVWPKAFPGEVKNVEMEVDADVYHSFNFVRQYLPGGKFQELTPPPAY
jgi:hypothetical protein